MSDIKQLENNMDNICDIGLNLFSDDLETLTLLMYCYQYVHRNLNKYDSETIPLSIYQNLLQQEKILTSRMKTSLKRVEIHCITQLWMNKDYDDPLLLGSRRNTELIQERIHKYLTRCKKEKYTGYQIMKWIGRLLISIKYMGHEVEISKVDLETFSYQDNTTDENNWKRQL